MFTVSEIAGMRDLSEEAMEDDLLVTETVEDTSGEPDGYGQYQTVTTTHVDQKCHVSDDKLMIAREAGGDASLDADALVRTSSFPAGLALDELSAEVTFNDVRRKANIQHVMRRDIAVYLLVRWQEAGVAA